MDQAGWLYVLIDSVLRRYVSVTALVFETSSARGLPLALAL